MSNRHHIHHDVLFSGLNTYAVGDCIEIQGEEAHHAVRVKRVKTGQSIGVLDGQGCMGQGVVRKIHGSKSKPSMTVELVECAQHERVSPLVELWAALPKGDRLDRMIDQLSQIGVSKFRPLLTERSQRKPETVKVEKLERIAREAAKQCHRPWVLEIGDSIEFEQAIEDKNAVVADASGGSWSQYLQASGIELSEKNARVVLLVGPEGGWSEGEQELIFATKASVVRFGIFVLRIEAAACSASAIVLSSAHETQRIVQ